MKPFRITLILTASLLFLASCSEASKNHDAEGIIEATEITVSAEVPGTLIEWSINEGDVLTIDTPIGLIDTTQLSIQKKQVLAKMNVLKARFKDEILELAPLRSQLKTARSERDRLTNLVKGNAATQKNLDDINAQIEVLIAQIEATKNNIRSNNELISAEIESLKANVELIDLNIQKSILRSPINGTILESFTDYQEFVVPGKPLFEIANLNEMTVKAYVTADQLSNIKLGQNITVRVDDGASDFKTYTGTINWISDRSEFTPKSIQTKNERINKVFAIKILVKNDGYLKIGQLAEIIF